MQIIKMAECRNWKFLNQCSLDNLLGTGLESFISGMHSAPVAAPIRKLPIVTKNNLPTFCRICRRICRENARFNWRIVDLLIHEIGIGFIVSYFHKTNYVQEVLEFRFL